MELNKDNYEYLMFELLEDNLKEADKNDLLNLINADAFYRREWTLMQHAVAVVDENDIMPGKNNLLRPIGKKLVFVNWIQISKVAASLLLLSSIGFWYYSSQQTNTIPLSQLPNQSTILKKEVKPNSLTKYDETKPLEQKLIKILMSPHPLPKLVSNALIAPIDTVLLPIAYEIPTIKSKSQSQVEYNMVETAPQFKSVVYSEMPPAKATRKFDILLANGLTIKEKAERFLYDIPNLHLKVTSHLKGKKRSIDFELQGETIYASAIIQLK